MLKWIKAIKEYCFKVLEYDHLYHVWQVFKKEMGSK